MRTAAFALGLALASCGGPPPPDRAAYLTGGKTFYFSEAASARLKALVARDPAPIKSTRVDAEPVGYVRIGETTYEFHGTLLRWVDPDHARVIRDPMLDFCWDGGPAPGSNLPVTRADEWLKKNP